MLWAASLSVLSLAVEAITGAPQAEFPHVLSPALRMPPRAGTQYPSVLLTGAASRERVDTYDSYSFIASWCEISSFLYPDTMLTVSTVRVSTADPMPMR